MWTFFYFVVVGVIFLFSILVPVIILGVLEFRLRSRTTKNNS